MGHRLAIVKNSLNNLIEGLDDICARLLNRGGESSEVHLSRSKTTKDILKLSSIVFGLELCYAAETAFVSPTLMSLGIPVSLMTTIWCLSPMLGFFLSPILGLYSDICTSKIGKRRPIIILLSIGILCGLFLVPNGDLLATLFANHTTEAHIAFTVFGTMLLDFCCDACQSPARTYLLDVTKPDEHPNGLSTFTIMAGLGGSAGYLIGSTPWERISFISSISQDHVRLVFAVVFCMFIACVLMTITSFVEKPTPRLHRNTSYASLVSDEDDSHELKTEINAIEQQAIKSDEQLLTFRDYLRSIIEMPAAFRTLCITNLFSWMSLVCYSLYFTDFVGQTVYAGDPIAPLSSVLRANYRDGVRFGSFAMAIYSLSCAIYSRNIETLLQTFGYKTVYVAGHLVYSIGMTVIGMTKNRLAVICCSTTAGIQYATLFTMPYLVVTRYHQMPHLLSNQETTYNRRGIGTDVFVVGSMVFLAQLLQSLVMGRFIEQFGSNVATVYMAAIFSLCGAYFASKINYGE